MDGKMRAMMFYAPGDVRFEETDIPRPKDGEILVKVKAATTCGTDLKTYRRGHPSIIKSVPSTFGHEFAGEVVEVGKDVDNFKIGDRVVGGNSAPCFHCYYCNQGMYSLCENLEFLNGAYSEYVAVPKQIVKYNYHKIPEGLDYREASLVEPLACALHGIERTPVRVGDVVAVIGAGPIGLMFIKLAALKGARVISIDLSDYRLEESKKFGAAMTVNPSKKDSVSAVKTLTELGKGPDVVIEATGFPEVWEQAINMVRPGGLVNLFGGTKKGTTFTIDCQLFHYSEITIKAVFHHTPYYVKKALELLTTRQVDGKLFITGEYPLEKTIDALESIGRQEGIKYAIIP
ncbi:zinc-dependent alcohol dehydrogenase [Geosporobacter ferrireducens]|uniref:Zinc-binding dehydrogenase n=1 Tax=Geosporobacter ferrireducens TaxID=1424294 RepID=A0A1D8GP16_9FIRM|nr:alcohol dehydrogenase catalytic domain-containing protein [Geosporobacter ferrireducens]AOT72635.1 zinc-binding dehydrogenase [Geosporobacter ferrireducens]MTI55037.1 zinc-binding dehydrogenase [Geosporobacter ferrireducens]